MTTKEAEDLQRSQMRKEIGINLSNKTISEKQSHTPLQEAILKLFSRRCCKSLPKHQADSQES